MAGCQVVYCVVKNGEIAGYYFDYLDALEIAKNDDLVERRFFSLSRKIEISDDHKTILISI
jgi:hypothetical protein